MATRLDTLTKRLSALEEAISLGALSITSDGQTVTWRSFSDQQKALRYLQTQIAIINGEAQANGASTIDLTRT